jgi:hypothetical protein
MIGHRLGRVEAAIPGGMAAMRRFIAKLNAERFRKQLLVETDPARRETLRRLLEVEEAKLRSLVEG